MTHYENIPSEIKRLKQWVCTFKHSKVPMNALELKPASSIDPTTWTTFQNAETAVLNGRYDYCGFVFNDTSIVGIDIDAGYDSEGFLTSLAADIIGRCKSYTERSKSGKGFHILIKGNIPFKGKNNLKGLEIYKSSRYFIMTGNVLLYRNIVEDQKAIDYIVNAYFPETQREKSGSFIGRIYSPIWSLPEDGRIKLRPIYPRIPNGCRNICLTSLAGMLHNQGYNKEQIYDELQYANTTACDPPLDNRELQTICNSVTRYAR